MPRGLLLAALAIGALLRVYPLHVPFIHPDQESIPLQALGMVAARTWRPPDLVYPSGFLYLLRTSYAAMGAGSDPLDVVLAYLRDPFPFLLVARVLACAFGIATIAAVAALGRELGDRWTGALAALVLATNILHVRESHYGTGDVPAAALVTAALVAAVAYVRTPRPGTLVVAGLAAGFAAGFRYPAAMALAGVATAAIVAPGVTLRTRALALGAAGTAALAIFFVATPYTLLDLERARARLANQLFWSRAAFLAPPGLPLRTLLPAVLGWLPLAAAVLGVAVLVATRLRAAAPLLVTTALVLGVLSQPHRIFARYTLAVVPALCALAAVGLRATLALVPARARPAAAVVLVGAVLFEPAARSVTLVRLLAITDTRVAAGAWLRDNVPDATAVWIPNSPTGYAIPVLPLTLGAIAWRLDRSLVPGLVARQRTAGPPAPAGRVAPYDASARSLEALGREGGFVVTSDHPVLDRWARTPPEVQDLLAARGTVVARFAGIDPAAAEQTLFEPIDANFVPLRGACTLDAPGPTITIWRLPPATGRG
ncbi:MAG TPA: glycosyltransferase family 39 protein [Candidatus Eisenbacteria bacterium]|nr:glycosyltransferase family 39 protein [Candidatus Eisenbacteria bacterium]